MVIDSKKIAIYLTNKCNLKCKHCFIEGSPKNKEFLSWEQIKAGLSYFYKNGFHSVEITGGESVLSPFFIDSVKEAKKIGYSVGVSTNGTNNHLFEIINPKIVNKVTFSLDGANAKTHDLLRGPNTYKLCLKHITDSVSAGYRVEVVYTVHSKNINEIGSVIKMLDDLKVNRVTFGLINNVGSALLHQDLLITPKDWIYAKKIINKNSNTKNLEIRYPMLFITKSEFKKLTKEVNYHCQMAKPVKIEIYPNGYFYGCCFATQSKNLILGQIIGSQIKYNAKKVGRYIQKHNQLTCPAIQNSSIFAADPNLVPTCLYYKNITCPLTK